MCQGVEWKLVKRRGRKNNAAYMRDGKMPICVEFHMSHLDDPDRKVEELMQHIRTLSVYK